MHLHCDEVVLVRERPFGRHHRRTEYRGAWSRVGQDLQIIVSRLPGRRAHWRAALRDCGVLWTDLATAEGKTPERALRELQVLIGRLRRAFGGRETRS
jgi:hypothetical protein